MAGASASKAWGVREVPQVRRRMEKGFSLLRLDISIATMTPSKEHIGKRVRWEAFFGSGEGVLLAINTDKSYMPSLVRDDKFGWIFTDDGTPEAEDAMRQGVKVGQKNCRWVSSYELIEPTMKTWESLQSGDKIKGGSCYELEVMGVLGNLVFLDEEKFSTPDMQVYTKDYLKGIGYTIVQDTPETIDIDGKKYNKDAVMERLEELDPIE